MVFSYLWACNHAIITLMLRLFSLIYQYTLFCLLFGTRRTDWVQATSGRRSKRSCISASHWPRASVSQLLQQCGAPTHITTGFHYTVTPTVRSTHAHRNGVSPYSPPLSFKEPLQLILTYPEHMKFPPLWAGDNINTKVSQTAS
jgi:hypothetical protein